MGFFSGIKLKVKVLDPTSAKRGAGGANGLPLYLRSPRLDDFIRRRVSLPFPQIAGRLPNELRFCGTHGCSCHSALPNAVITDRKFWPAKVKSELRPLLAKYLP
jgi:hypothetical protein